MSIPLDALTGPWMGIISLGLYFGLIGIISGADAVIAKWRKARSQ